MDSIGLEKSGYLDKKAQVMPSWNRRYCVCDPANLRLKYYKDRPKNVNEKERGELKITDCTVSVDASNNEGEYRFLITTADHRKTFHLQTDDEYEMKEWIRIIHLISDLGMIKQKLMEEEKMNDNSNTFKFAVETLLERLDNRASESRKSLDKVAQQKWNAKSRLIEIRDEMEEKHRKLRLKQGEMKAQEKEYRDTLSHLNQALYVLQQQVRKSNEIQQSIVEIFGDTSDPNATILDKVKTAIELCRNMLAQDYQHNKRLSNSSIAFKRQVSNPENTANKNGKDNNNKNENGNDNTNENDKKTQEVDRRKGRARSHSDLTVSKTHVSFEDEMIKILIELFPTASLDGNMPTEQKENDEDAASNNIVKILELYHRYYVEVHLPREMDLRKVRTKCEQKWNSLRYVSNKKELARREEDEIDWIGMEMKRAIDRLNREGVPETPIEKERKEKAQKGKNSSKNNGNISTKSNYNQEPDHYQPPQNVHRDSTTMIPVLAHRSTWSESSDVIFQLNVARQQQYQATRELEDSLKSREVVKSWYEDKIAIHK